MQGRQTKRRRGGVAAHLIKLQWARWLFTVTFYWSAEHRYNKRLPKWLWLPLWRWRTNGHLLAEELRLKKCYKSLLVDTSDARFPSSHRPNSRSTWHFRGSSLSRLSPVWLPWPECCAVHLSAPRRRGERILLSCIYKHVIQLHGWPASSPRVLSGTAQPSGFTAEWTTLFRTETGLKTTSRLLNWLTD